MKQIIQVLILMLLFQNCCPGKLKSNIAIRIDISNKPTSGKFTSTEGEFYNVKIGLSNNTDSIINFWTMKCSWQDNWISNDNSITLVQEICDSNFPVVETIMPKETKIFNGSIRVLHPAETLKNKVLKFGFVFMEKQEIENISNFREALNDNIKTQYNIIWSDPLAFTSK